MSFAWTIACTTPSKTVHPAGWEPTQEEKDKVIEFFTTPATLQWLLSARVSLWGVKDFYTILLNLASIIGGLPDDLNDLDEISKISVSPQAKKKSKKPAQSEARTRLPPALPRETVPGAPTRPEDPPSREEHQRRVAQGLFNHTAQRPQPFPNTWRTLNTSEESYQLAPSGRGYYPQTTPSYEYSTAPNQFLPNAPSTGHTSHDDESNQQSRALVRPGASYHPPPTPSNVHYAASGQSLPNVASTGNPQRPQPTPRQASARQAPQIQEGSQWTQPPATPYTGYPPQHPPQQQSTPIPGYHARAPVAVPSPPRVPTLLPVATPLLADTPLPVDIPLLVDTPLPVATRPRTSHGGAGNSHTATPQQGHSRGSSISAGSSGYVPESPRSGPGTLAGIANTEVGHSGGPVFVQAPSTTTQSALKGNAFVGHMEHTRSDSGNSHSSASLDRQQQKTRVSALARSDTGLADLTGYLSISEESSKSQPKPTETTGTTRKKHKLQESSSGGFSTSSSSTDSNRVPSASGPPSSPGHGGGGGGGGGTQSSQQAAGSSRKDRPSKAKKPKPPPTKPERTKR
ncbi:hypothetical protein B0T26DRAFT_778724 [Lasiosphaeria miniovina]|uniref:Uncharacterized protein n=1 Tax=Lasiosphaeria miniovina TaxID=1954250 RepID=A0AA40AME6_9PEZI|nr:uncharacterized protein B0T26DRAFT_778724 [Lasiosphaeria miniovina]KAK0718532.1 hypothetical protein B0T26DRAFT_778724 [Lasiosphaeria miniovina]